MVDCADADARVTEAGAMRASWEFVVRREGWRLLGQVSW
jgi:hypothetical protein